MLIHPMIQHEKETEMNYRRKCVSQYEQLLRQFDGKFWSQIKRLLLCPLVPYLLSPGYYLLLNLEKSDCAKKGLIKISKGS